MIIKTSIPAEKYDGVVSYFAMCIGESIAALDNSDFASLEWYADCTLDDYFTEMPDLWSDEGEHLGNGFNMTFAKVILNDDTREDLENAFEKARESEYEEALERFSDRVWDEVKDYTPYDDDDPLSSDFEKWCEQGEMNSCFVDANVGVTIYKIWEDSSRKQAINVIFADGKMYRY